MNLKDTLLVSMLLFSLIGLGKNIYTRQESLSLLRLKNSNKDCVDRLFIDDTNNPIKKINSRLEITKIQKLDYITYKSVNGDSSKREFVYDINENVISDISYYWDSSNGRWIGSDKREFVYDINGVQISEIKYIWDKYNEFWVGYFKIEKTTNIDTISIITYQWEINSNIWKKSSKDDLIYNKSQNLTEIFRYIWDLKSQNWKNISKITYNYDLFGYVLSSVTYYLNDNFQWKGSYKTEYTYDLEGNKTSDIEMAWDENHEYWLDIWKNEYRYNSNAKIISSTFFNQEPGTGWIAREQYNYQYDDNGNLILSIRSGEFGIIKNIYEFDLSLDFNQLLLPHHVFASNNKLLKSKNYKIDNGNCTLLNQVTYNYSNMPSNSDNFTVYPNPVRDYFTIEITSSFNNASFDLYNPHGQKIVSKEILQKEQINLSKEISGIYFYQITINGVNHKGSLIKE